MTVLPQELVDAIVSNLNDKASLEACSLTAKAFVPPSQRLLFDRMNFAVALVSRVSEIFSQSPHLVAFIRIAEIETSRTLEDCIALESLLRILLRGKLQRLSIRGNLDRIPATLRQTLADLISQSSLQTVELMISRNAPFPLLATALASCRSVSFSCQSIGFAGHCSESAAVEDPGDGAPLANSVEELVVTVWGTSGDFFRHPDIVRCLGRLRRLEIHLRGFMAIRPACCTTLTGLTIYDFAASRSRLFPHLPALRILTLWSGISRFAAELSLIAEKLPTAIPLLEVLTIVAAAKTQHPPPFEQIPRPEVDAGLAALLRLREVRFTLLDGYGGPIEPSGYRDCFERELPQARSAGLLAFTFTKCLQHRFCE
ncbi:hypothetical protein K438DRAFT_1820522 [Mycena galopus ATCC 62051]|nr:hypothetical protein K438DRAFT_1820522 [Mycena galopus ATCC 62051]